VFSTPYLTGDARGAEQRSSPRVELPLPCRGSFRNQSYRYRLVDISQTGALVERLEGPSPPSLHSFEIDTGDDVPLKLLARTVWTNRHQHAVRFVAQDDLDKLELAEAIDRLVKIHAA
jgi:hypothetical protein